MAKKVAVLAVNPVNGFGLFQYLEAFFENEIPYRVYAVAETKEIKSNSGISLWADDVIANLKAMKTNMMHSCFLVVTLFPYFRKMQTNHTISI